MGKKKDSEKKKKKTAQLVIRINREERDIFIQLCEQLDTSAAREIRRFMRDWVVRNQPSSPPEPTDQAPEAEPHESEAEDGD